MEKIKKWLPSKRKLMQLYFGLLMNANLKGFVSGNLYKGGSKAVCTPGLNCYSCPGAVSACPLGALQGSFQAGRSTLFYVGGILLLYGILFGRLICGWLCPFGLIQEVVYKVKTPKMKKSPLTRLLSYGKYVILVFFVFLIPIGYAFRDVPLPAFCKLLCPAGTLEGGLILLSNAANKSYLSLLGPLFTWKFLLSISIILGCVFIFRLFCRFICPLGAIYGLFNKFSFFGIQVDAQKCVDCDLCASKCLMDIKRPGDMECISCGECMKDCPTEAIGWKNAGSIPKLERNPVSRIICSILMIAVLVGAICYSWRSSDAATAPTIDYSYDLSVIDESGLTGATIDPTKTGTLTIINFWGTWCGPCVEELPYFDQIASEYEQDVTVIAVHTDMASDTAPEFIQKYYPNSKIIFAKDYDNNGTEGYYTALGGRNAYPYTVILNKNGTIQSEYVGAVNYQELQKAILAN